MEPAMTILKYVNKALGVAAFAALATISFGAHADAIIDCCFTTGVNTLQDSDADRILRGGMAVTGGTFQSNDVIQSLLRIDTVNGNDIQVATQNINYQLIAIASLTLGAITDTNGGTCDVGDTCVAQATPTVNVYEFSNNSTNFLAQAPDTAISTITSTGTLVLSLANTQPDDFWTITFTRTAAGEITTIASATPGSPQAGLFVFGTSATANPGNIPFTPNAMPDGVTGALHDFVGNGSGYQRETGVNSGWLFSTNTSVSFLVVPEPGTLLLIGLGLSALGFGLRRKV